MNEDRLSPTDHANRACAEFEKATTENGSAEFVHLAEGLKHLASALAVISENQRMFHSVLLRGLLLNKDHDHRAHSG